MNLSRLMGNKKAAYAILERGALPSGTSCINDNANVEINIETAIANLEQLKGKYTALSFKKIPQKFAILKKNYISRENIAVQEHRECSFEFNIIICFKEAIA